MPAMVKIYHKTVVYASNKGAQLLRAQEVKPFICLKTRVIAKVVFLQCMKPA